MNQNKLIILLLILYVLMFGLVGKYEARFAELENELDVYKEGR
jgi:hypothetical protein